MPSSTDAGANLDSNSTRDSFIPLFSGLEDQHLFEKDEASEKGAGGNAQPCWQFERHSVEAGGKFPAG